MTNRVRWNKAQMSGDIKVLCDLKNEFDAWCKENNRNPHQAENMMEWWELDESV